MITESYALHSEYANSFLIRYTRVYINVKEKIWLTEHHHTEIELGFYLKGSGTYLSGKRQFPFAPGDVLLFGSNADHIIQKVSYDSDIELINLHFDPRLLWDSGNTPITKNNLRNFVMDLAGKAYHLQPGQPPYGKICPLLDSVVEEFRTQDTEFPLSVWCNLLQIMILLMRSFPPAEAETGRAKTGRQHFAELETVINYILKHLYEQLTLDSLAQEAHISRSYLCALFKETYGMTIWEYITIKRVDLASHYLRETQEPVTDICEKCGFNTLANFNRAFRKVNGQSPSEYRKKMLNIY